MTAPLQCAFDYGDICARKHGGNPRSVEANARVRKRSDRERVRLLVYGYGWGGLTLKEACRAMHKTPNQISGRFTALKAGRQIFDSGRTREGCTVYVGRKEWVNGSEGGM